MKRMTYFYMVGLMLGAFAGLPAAQVAEDVMDSWGDTDDTSLMTTGRKRADHWEQDWEKTQGQRDIDYLFKKGSTKNMDVFVVVQDMNNPGNFYGFDVDFRGGDQQKLLDREAPMSKKVKVKVYAKRGDLSAQKYVDHEVPVYKTQNITYPFNNRLSVQRDSVTGQITHTR